MHKRYSEFSTLHTALKKHNVVLPKPPPRYLTQKTNTSDQVRGERQVLLDKYLQDLILHPALQNSTDLVEFLTLTLVDESRSRVKAPGQSDAASHAASTMHVTVFHADDTILHHTVEAAEPYANQVLQSLGRTLRVSDIWCYRLAVVGNKNSTLMLEERDHVVKRLQDFNSSTLALTRYGISAVPARQGVDLTIEYRTAANLLTRGVYVVSAEDFLELFVGMFVVDKCEMCLGALGDKEFSILSTLFNAPALTTSSRKSPVGIILPSVVQSFVDAIASSLPAFAKKLHEPKYWACQMYIALKERRFDMLDTNSIMHRFVCTLRKYPFYGCRIFFEVPILSIAIEGANDPTLKLGQKINVGVNWDGIHLFEPHTMRHILRVTAEALKTPRSSLDSCTLEWRSEGDASNTLKIGTRNGYRVVACITWFRKARSKYRKGSRA
eukprot:c20082_g3_i1.p1 GENE.c20082_g3_i1~~c20082_g3_i1.p1  ORF type:complete len:439 (+),score=85.32 c20082_g3_i1:742-2058(+)